VPAASKNEMTRVTPTQRAAYMPIYSMNQLLGRRIVAFIIRILIVVVTLTMNFLLILLT
jgi:hypothetical protein